MSTTELSLRDRLTAIAAVVSLFGGVGLYVREYPVFTNTIGAGGLVAGALVAGSVAAAALLYRWRGRFAPAGRHVPEILLISLGCLLFSPLVASVLNRVFGRDTRESCEFLDERPFVSTGGYGMLRTGQIRISGYQLDVRENGRLLRFRYKKQAYFPITKPGEEVLVPIRKGLFGFRVVTLE